MKKTKLLIGACGLAVLAPTLPVALTSCNKTTTYTVTFDSDGGSDVASQIVLAGNKAANPVVEKAGYKLVGWFNGDVQWDFSTPVTSNITLKAHWDTKPITLVLYAGEGAFTDGAVKTITNIAPGTKLGQIKDYVKPTKSGETFAYWVDVENYKYTDDTEITENLLLGARFIEAADESTDYKTCNWANIVKYTSSAVAFANKFMAQTFTEGTDEEAAIALINNAITNDAQADAGSETNFTDRDMTLTSLGTSATAKVRLVGVGFDKNKQSTNAKTLFTFEFAYSISKAQYSYHANNAWCRIVEGEEQDSCYLRDYCNTYLINALPATIVDNIKVVTKRTKEPKPSVSSAETAVETQELLFPLSFAEMGMARATKVSTYNLSMEEKATLTYPYYRFTTDTSILGEKHSRKPSIADITSSPTYWTRDPVNVFNGSAIYRRVYCVCMSQSQTIWDYTDNQFSIAPAFCL